MKLKIALLFIFYSLCFYSQNNIVNNKWILNKTIDCLSEKLIHNTKWNIEFDSLNKAIITIKTLNLKKEQSFTINNNLLEINQQKYKIEKVTNDTLILSRKIADLCEKYIFESESLLNKRQKEKHFIHNGELVYYSNDYNSPKLEDAPNLLDYFSDFIPFKNRRRSKCDLIFYFIINKKGELIEPKGNISCLKNSDKKVAEIFEKTRYKWKPMYIDNEAVNSFVRIKFKYNVEIH